MSNRALRETASDWRPNSPQARALADSLRSVRLTIVLGPDKRDLTALLAAGVLPLLGRRAVDSVAAKGPAAPRVVIPFPERRRIRDGPPTEILILFDASRERTLALLESRFDVSVRAAGCRLDPAAQSLADRMRALADELGTRFLFVVDGFDALLPMRSGRGRPDPLIEALIEVLESPLPANVLLSAHAGARRLLEGFTNRLHGAEPAWFELEASEPEREESIESTHSAPQVSEPKAANPVPAAAEETSRPESADAAPRPDRTSHRKPLAPIAVVATLFIGVLLVAASVWLGSRNRDDRVPSAAVADAEAEAAANADRRDSREVEAATAAMPLQLLVEAEGEVAPKTARELVGALARDLDADVSLRVAKNIVSSLAAVQARNEPALAIVRYDALQALPRSPVPVVVIAPLYTEDLVAVVRADSPLRYVHEIKGRRINVGAANGGRAATAARLYRKMFGAALPSTAAGHLDASAGLRTLAGGRRLDVVFLVGPQVDEALGSLSPEQRRSLRPLQLARTHPASRKAAQTYLMSTLRSNAGGAFGAGVPSWAVLDLLIAVEPTGPSTQAPLPAQVTDALCKRLGLLQRQGDAKWREVTPGLQLPIALRGVIANPARDVWAQCARR